MCSSNATGMDVLVWRIGAFLFPILGIPGHLLIIVTILRTDRRRFHPTSLYFLCMAIAESIYLSFMFWDWLDIVNLAPDPRKILNCGYFYPFVHSTAFISQVLLVLLNLDRVSMIHTPQKTHWKITNNRILVKILLTYSTSILFCLHYRFSVKYDQNAFTVYGQACSVYENAHLWFYSIWPYIHLLCRLFPCIILILCTIYICRNRSNPTRSTSSSIHRQQHTSSLALVFVSIYTLVAVMPITILQIFNDQMNKHEIDFIRYDFRYDAHVEKANTWKLWNALFIMWEASTYMNKFYIRFVISPDFRSDVKQISFGRSHKRHG